MKREKKCSTPGCQDKAMSLGFCSSCYGFHKYWEYRSVKDKVNHNRKMKVAGKRKRSNLLFGHAPSLKKVS